MVDESTEAMELARFVDQIYAVLERNLDETGLAEFAPEDRELALHLLKNWNRSRLPC